jgi:putative aldouronate transport system substrate-binding protein
MKRFVVLTALLALGAASLCFAGGGAQGAGGATRPAGMTASGYPVVTDGSVTLRYWTPLQDGASKFIKSYAENTAYQEFNKRTGIKIEWVHPAVGMEREQFNLMLASGDLPDIIGAVNYYRGSPFQGLYDGLFMDLTDPISKWAPDYYGILKGDEEFYREVSDDSGRLCFFGAYKPGGDVPWERPLLRTDVLAELGKDIPKTLDDWENLFAAMLAKGITPYMLTKSGYERQFIGSFGIMAGSMAITGSGGTNTDYFYKDAQGKLYYGQTRPEFKQYLELMNRWYSKGYISKDFTSVDNSQKNTLFDTKKIGMLFGAIVGNYNRASGLGFKVTSAPYPRVRPGDQLHLENTDIWPLKNNDNANAALSAKCKNVEAAVRWLNYAYSEPGALLLNWGVEGINYTLVNGKKVYNDRMLNNPQLGTHEASYVYKMHGAPKRYEKDVECHASLLKTPESLAARMLWADDIHVDTLSSLPPYQLTEAEQNTRTRIMTEISTYADEMVLKFITGVENLNRFDAFVTTINNMGLADALKSEQGAYDRYLKKKLK